MAFFLGLKMKNPLAGLYLKFRRAPVHRAETQQARDAIYRFRYTVYVEELEREIGGVDHQRRMVCEDEDEAPWSHHLYVGSLDSIEASVRLRIWKPGEVPATMWEVLSLDRFGPVMGQMTIAELGRFMISSQKRGGSILLGSLAYATYTYLGAQHEVDLSFSYCRPGLVPYYRRLGGRPYGGSLIYAPEGMEVPLVSVMSDKGYYKKVGSPMAPLVSKVFGKGKRVDVDDSSFRHLFDNDRCGVITESEAIWDQFADTLSGPIDESTFLSTLNEETIVQLSNRGFIMDLEPNSLVTREGHSEREMFVVLQGELEVLKGGTQIAKVGRGEVFGEMAFFLERGKRTASVKTLRASKIVVIKRSFIDELHEKDPDSARAILFSLGRVLAVRLDETR